MGAPERVEGRRPEPVEGEIVGIAAVARNGVIGADNDIPWRIPADWARFKQRTMGQVLIMGRKTFASIGRPLPGRTTFVVTRDTRWRAEGVCAVRSLDDAFDQATARNPETIFVAGGGEIYRAAWGRLTGLEITEVDAEPEGDVTFPEIDPRHWSEVYRSAHEGYAFVHYRRL